MTDELVKDLRQNQGGWCPTAVIVKAADTIEQQSKLLDQALETMERSLSLMEACWNGDLTEIIDLQSSITAIKQFKVKK